METMRLLFMVVTIWTTIAGSTCGQQPHTDQSLWARSPPPPPPPAALPTLAALDLTEAANYDRFIKDMRDELAEKENGKDVLVCTMKKISSTVPTPRYGYVDIVASRAITITLAIDRTNIYVMGYRDIFKGNERAFFFKEDFDKATNIFPNARGNNRVKLGYTAQYTSLGDRLKVPLGILDLTTSIDNVYGKVSDSKFIGLQKKFFLIAIQMVSEATRFKEISNKIPLNDYESFTPDAKVVALENGWDTLSTAVYDQTEPSSTPTKCKLTVASISVDNKWNFKSVEEIANVVGILKAKGNRSSMTNEGDDDEDDGGVVAVASS